MKRELAAFSEEHNEERTAFNDLLSFRLLLFLMRTFCPNLVGLRLFFDTHAVIETAYTLSQSA